MSDRAYLAVTSIVAAAGGLIVLACSRSARRPRTGSRSACR